MRTCFLLLGLVLVAACRHADANLYGGPFGQRVVGNAQYVTVSNVWNEMDALPLAEAHCKTHRKAARFNRMEEARRAIFDCN